LVKIIYNNKKSCMSLSSLRYGRYSVFYRFKYKLLSKNKLIYNTELSLLATNFLI